jgi:hypothetical protein
MPEGPSIGPRKLAQSDLDIPSAGLTDVSYWQLFGHGAMSELSLSGGKPDLTIATADFRV